MSDQRRPAFTLFLCTICICIPAFINNFPFVYADTGSYLFAGFTSGVSYIRPILYGIFLRHVCLFESFWLVVLAQAFLTAWMMRLFVRSFFDTLRSIDLLMITAALTLGTSIGISNGMLMPDFTTALMVLATAVLLLSKRLKTWELIFTGVYIWFSVACHHSHTYILLLALLC